MAAAILRPTPVWLPRTPEPPRAESLADLGLETILALLLAGRGISEPSEAEAFLDPSLARLHPPSLLADMDLAVERLLVAVREHETLLVHGDYDVDGLSGAAMLARCLGKLGARPRVHIPDRFSEGYGVSANVVELARQHGATLVVTCDCGVRAIAEAHALREAGIDLIVTDHHEPGSELPPAIAVLDPKREDSGYPFRHLAGVGVAFKLLEALSEALGVAPIRFHSHYLDLAALGTIADVVELHGENRVLAAQGLRCLRATEKVGLRALLRACKLEDRALAASDVGFRLAPRLNAAGRLDHANSSLKLLLTTDRSEAESIARELEHKNRERQALEREMEEDALRHLAAHAEVFQDDPVLVLGQPRWHRGVAGLVAGRVRERLGRPTIILCPEDNGLAVGSGRSIEGYHLADALDEVSEVLQAHGGHAMAAGLTLATERIGEFRRRINDSARARPELRDLAPVRRYDLELRAGQIRLHLANELERLSPFGAGNPEPVFMTRGLPVEYVSTLGGDGEHLRMALLADGREVPAILWRHGARAREVSPGMHVDVLYSIETRMWQGIVELQLRLIDFRPSAD